MFVKANRSFYNPFLEAMSSKSLTKLVLLGEIVAICILHSVKMNHAPKTQQTGRHIAYGVQKKLAETPSVSFANHR
jgi:hypothetical protein